MSHISYSELKEWVTCPWKHKLNYIEGLREFKGNEYTAFGTALHTVCENLVQFHGTNAAPVFEPKQMFQEEFLRNLQKIKAEDPEIEYRGDLIMSMRAQGETLTDYILPGLKKTFGTFELVAVEEKLYDPIEGTDLNFKGFIDLVIKTKDGTTHIIDWKTCSWGWDSRRRSDKMVTYQLTLYKHFWCEKHGVSPSKVQTHFALLKRTAKSNLVEIFEVSNGAKKVQNALKLLNKALYNIKKSNSIKNKLSCYGRFGKCEYYKTKHCT
tara:strand:- start:21605 stop:22405 length:801 start_codon:yes stop_codon:yes gene_type:complete